VGAQWCGKKEADKVGGEEGVKEGKKGRRKLMGGKGKKEGRWRVKREG